jgi:hypothetical protein
LCRAAAGERATRAVGGEETDGAQGEPCRATGEVNAKAHWLWEREEESRSECNPVSNYPGEAAFGKPL